MKSGFKLLLIPILTAIALLPVRAQQQPVLSVSITHLDYFDIFGNGSLSYVAVTNGGSGYTSAPTVVISSPGTAIQATATATLSGTGTVASVSVTNPGAGYGATPTVTFSAPGGAGTTATGTATVSGGTVVAITVNNPGSGYASAPTVTIGPPSATGTATATATVSGGKVVSINLTNAGSGYTRAPDVTLIGGGGTGATAAVSVAPNEASGPAGSPIAIYSLGVGTHLQASYTYSWFVNGIPIGTTQGAVAPPTEAVDEWTPPQPGSYFITVTATDGTNTATSLPIRYFATGTVVNSPLNGKLVPAGSSVVLKADATVPSGFIKQIQFFDSVNGGPATAIGTDSTIPYSLIFTPSGAGATAGTTHDITAQATDNNNVTTAMSAPVRLNMVTPITPVATCTLTSPADGAVIGIPPSGNSIPVLVDASSSTGRISQVELYIDGQLFATNTNYPYAFNWNPTVVGKYDLVALAYDDKNNVIASSQNTVSIAPPPTVAITVPTSGGTVTGGSPTRLSAAVSDSNTNPLTGLPVGIRSVQFFVDTIFQGEATNPDPLTGVYSISATLTQKLDKDGNILPSVITAIATDNAGISGVSPGVSVSVTQGGSSTGGTTIGSPPTVALTAPIAGTQITVNTPVLVTANAADTDGNVVSVQFFANNTAVGTSNSYPYSATWTPAALGNYTMTAKATDNDGNIVTSGAVQVSVIDPTPTAPTVSITAPTNGTSVAVGSTQQLKADATSSGAIGSVQFFVNGQPFGTAITAFPYTTSWTPATPGSYTIVARATNATGLQGNSAPITVTVSAGTPPVVNVTSPLTASSLTVSTPQTITATATSATSTISSVQFFVNGVSVGTDTTFPYSAPWTPIATGSYTIMARATDAVGNTTDSTTVVVTVGGGVPPTIALTNPAANSSYTVGTPLALTATAADADGTVAQVQFFVNGVAVGTSTSAPYTANWTPSASGTYTLTAQATDNAGNVTTSAPITVNITGNGAPTVSIITPKSSITASAGTVVTLTALAADADGTVTRVRFLANGTVVGTPATSVPFTTGWTPSAAGTYTVVAEATDNSGNVTNSAPVTIRVIANQPPNVAIQSPLAGFSTTAGVAVVLSASASDPDGTIAGVRFIVNGSVVGSSITSPPYSMSWTPTNAGTYSIIAEATDNTGNVSTSNAVTISVAGNIPPTISITTPTTGSTVIVGAAQTIEATAKDTDGTVALVQIYVNGVALGSPLGIYPYRVSWTPNAEGIYRISATATDNGGASATSATTTVLAVGANSTAADRVYAGPFNALGDTGKFAVVVSGPNATFIGYSNKAPAKIFYFPDMTVDASGGFTGSDTNGHTVTGTVSDTGVTVMLDQTLLIGVLTSGSVGFSGHYSGSLDGNSSSALDGIVGPDGSLMLWISNGTSADVAAGTLTSRGAAAGSITTVVGGNKVTVAIDPRSSFLTGTVAGTGGGTFTAALSTGAAISDGSLRNLSTRGQVGTGANILIAGFVVGGDTPKNVLVRAIGPGLAPFGISGTLADPQLQLYRVSTQIASNDNWENNADIAAASAKVGAFGLNPTSKDSALLVQLAPGTYSAQVVGVGGSTGIAMVEIYDVDDVSPFSPQKVMNVSTRGVVGTGQAQLIAGFVVGGNISKKVLIRAVGPTLSSYGVPSGTLGDPMLRLSHLVNGVDTTVRENNDWDQGNDPALISDASAKAGAFPLPSGSKDAAILITLPPGTYTAQATGVNGTTGIALVEVYEIP